MGRMVDFALDLDPTSENYLDLLFDDTGDIILTSDADARGPNPVLQDAVMALRAFRGEWFMNQGDGMPYFQTIFRKGTSLATVQTIIQDTLLAVPGLIRLNSLQVTFDAAHRALNVTFDADSIAGPIQYSDTLPGGNS